jgi:hypothetical protein
MNCAAVSEVIVTKVSMLTTSNSQVNRGMRMRVMPLQRIEMMVAMIFTAVPNVPNPPTINASAQQSVACPGENERAVSGA